MKTAEPLFRPQAIGSRNDYQLGSSVSLLPWSWSATVAFFVILFIATFAFLALANFPRKESAIGILRLSKGEIRVVSPREGVVVAINVAEGDVVAQGDVLAFVTTEQRLSMGANYDAQILAAVEREKTMLGQRLTALNASEPLQAAALRQRIDGLDKQMSKYSDDRKGRVMRLGLTRDSLKDYTKLLTDGIYGTEVVRQKQHEMLQQDQSL